LDGLMAADIAQAIANLPAIYRQVLILRDIEANSAPEVAETLNISVAAVKSRLRRARVHLRDTLQTWE
jgi:RNA polymerase sigma factor (sigma-70 family)